MIDRKTEEFDAIAWLAKMQQLEARAWELFNREEYDKAIEAFDRLFTYDATHAGAFQGKIAALRKKGEFTAASKLLARALTTHKTQVGLLCEQMWLHVEQKQYDAAIDAADTVLQADDREQGIAVWKIFLLRYQRRFDAAASAIQQAKAQFPNSAAIEAELGWLRFHQRRYEQAMQVFQELVRRDPSNESAVQGYVASLRMQGRYGEANRLATRSLRKLKNSPGIQSERAWIAFAQGDYRQAEADFAKVVELLRDDPCSYVNLAWSLVRQETDAARADAAELCRKALGLEPRLAPALGCLGIIAFKEGRMRDAEAHFLESIDADPLRGHYTDLGALYIQMGRYDEGETVLAKAIANDYDDAYAHVQMGNLHLQRQQVHEAIRESRLATMIDGNDPDGFKALAIALMEGGELVEAEKVLRSSLKRLDRTKRWELHLTLCRLLTRIGDETDDRQFYEEALKEVTSAIQVHPNSPAPYFHGGIVRYKLEDYRGALKYFRRCRKEDDLYLEAELNAKRIRSLLRREQRLSRSTFLAGALLGVIFLAQLVGLWILFLVTDQITETMLTVLVPILLGLMVVAVLLPWLSRLKITGLEAELSEPRPRESLASGPKGAIGFGSAGK